MRTTFLLVTFVLCALSSIAYASNNHSKGHDHENHEGHDHESHEGHDHADHGDHEGHDHHGHGGSKAIGKNKAITEVHEEKGFKLSPQAIQNLGLKLEGVSGDTIAIKKTTLVTSKDTKGLYRFREGFFKLLPVEILKEEQNTYRVKVKGLGFGDQIVVNGLGLLRVTDVYSTDESEYGHSH